ncbi:MAG: phage tail tape measure protein [Selenomonadaceae bacterium]|nr:phage tail tape measure protein [Selenomonadaceae bacterium]
MAKEFLLSAVLEFKDKMTAGIKSARQGVEGLKGSIEGVRTAGMQSELQKAGAAADKLRQDASGLKSALQSVSGAHHVTLDAQDNATDKARRATDVVKSFSAAGTRSANLHANDEATPVVTRLREKLAALTGKPYTVQVNAAGAGSVLARAGGAVSGVAGGMLANTSMQMAGAAGIGYGLYDMIKSASDFEKGMSGVQAISGATGAAMDALTQKALEMGQTTKFTATESAQALNYMAMAGWNTDQMLSGLPGVMNLAAASGEDLAMVSDIVTDAMTAFKVPTEESGHFADVLSAAAANANTNVGMMGYTFKYAGSFAGALGYSIEDVALATGAMADSSIKADQAGTSLRALMERMAKPTKESQSAMDELGISAFDAAGKARPLRDVLDELRQKFKGLNGQDKARLGAELAGTEGSAGFLSMMNESQEKWDQIKDAIDNADGAAERMANVRMDNLAGSVTLLGSAWESFSIKLMKGTGTADGIRAFVDEGTKLVTNFTSRIEKNGLTVTSVFDTIGEGIGDLVQKFLKLDGIGSVLAGGALAAGLYKIVSLTKKATDAISGILGRKGPASVPSGAPAGSSVGSMTISATTVIVNGQNVTGGAGVPAGSAPAPGPAGQAAGGVRSVLREMAPGLAVAGVLAAVDVFSTRSQNENNLKDAASYLKDASDHLEVLKEQGAPQEQIEKAASEVERLAQYQQDVQTQADTRLDESIGQSIGTVAGTVIGGALGSFAGPIGTQIGMVAGGIIGDQIGTKIGGYVHDVSTSTPQTYKNVVEYETRMDDYDQASYNYEAIGEEGEVDIQANLLAPTPENVQDVVSQTQEGMADVDITALDDNAGNGLIGDDYQGGDSAIPFIQSIRDWINGRPFDELDAQTAEVSSNMADDFDAASAEAAAGWDETSSEISDASSNAEMNSEESWSLFSSFFDSSVESPVSSSADDTGSFIAQAFEQSNSDSESAWADTPGWFNGNVYGPVASDADVCASNTSSNLNSGIQIIESAWNGLRNFFSGLFSDISASANGIIAKAGEAISAAGNLHTDEREYTETEVSGAEGYWTGTTSFAPAFSAGTTSFVPAFATGGIASFSPANVAHGLAQINEHGGELIDLPQGSRIYPAATTERLIERQLEQEAPSSMPTVNITGNNFTVREEADIQKIAYELAKQIFQAHMNYGGAY